MQPTEALAQHADKKLNGLELYFELALHEAWELPLDNDDLSEPQLKVFTDKAEQPYTMLFSSPKIVEQFKDKAEKNQQYRYKLTAEGHALFQALPDELAYVLLNPGTAHAHKVPNNTFELLKEAGQVAELDASIAALAAGEGHVNDHLRTIRDFEHYLLVMSQSGHPAIAPDDQNRTMMAVFTYQQALDMYKEWTAEAGHDADFIVKVVSGQTLFKAVTKIKVDGIVLNCFGPVGKRTFVPKIFELINDL